MRQGAPYTAARSNVKHQRDQIGCIPLGFVQGKNRSSGSVISEATSSSNVHQIGLVDNTRHAKYLTRDRSIEVT